MEFFGGLNKSQQLGSGSPSDAAIQNHGYQRGLRKLFVLSSVGAREHRSGAHDRSLPWPCGADQRLCGGGEFGFVGAAGVPSIGSQRKLGSRIAFCGKGCGGLALISGQRSVLA